MKRRLVFSSVLVIATLTVTPAIAEKRIADDVGGRIGAYVDQYKEIRNSGERVVIDGTCLSACTLVLGIVPRNRICMTRKAVLGFHAAWMPGEDGKPVPSSMGTQAMWELYPQNVRRWINAHGGLTTKMLQLRGSELAAMYPECKADSAFASAAPRSPIALHGSPTADIHSPH